MISSAPVRPQNVVWDVRAPASGASLLDSVNGTDPVEEPGCCTVAVGKPVNKLECRKQFKNDVIQLQEAQSDQRTAPTSGLQQLSEIAATKDLNKLQAFGKHRVVVASAQEIASLSFKKNACRDVYTEMF